MLIIVPVLLMAVAVILLFVIYSLEQHANNRRIERGEVPKRHHDLTDYPPPVEVIDWSNRK